MGGQGKLSQVIDEKNDAFTSGVKQRLLSRVPSLPDAALEWLVMEHYQFSVANTDLLMSAMESTKALADKAVAVELERNAGEENGHAPMYKQGMLEMGTDMDRRVEFAPTTRFLSKVAELSAPEPSRALGAFYATETAAIFEHETFLEICRVLAERRGFTYDGSLIKYFHDLHLDGGVEQGHKDGLAAFVDVADPGEAAEGEPIDKTVLYQGAMEAIDAMHVWWDALLDRAFAIESAPAG